MVHNPAVKLDKYFQEAPVVHQEIEPLTADTVPIFLAEARQRDSKRWKSNPEYFPLYLCAIHTGMRAGELAGLQWPDIDWKGKYLIVRRSIKKGKVYQTKTKRIRRIDISDELLAELKSYRQRRLEEALKDGKNEIPEWVFGTCGGSPSTCTMSRGANSGNASAAKLHRIRFHDLRHYVLYQTMS